MPEGDQKNISKEAEGWSQGYFQGHVAATLESLTGRIDTIANDTGRQWDAIGETSKTRQKCREHCDDQFRKIKIMSGVGHTIIVACTAVLTWIASKIGFKS